MRSYKMPLLATSDRKTIPYIHENLATPWLPGEWICVTWKSNIVRYHLWTTENQKYSSSDLRILSFISICGICCTKYHQIKGIVWKYVFFTKIWYQMHLASMIPSILNWSIKNSFSYSYTCIYMDPLNFKIKVSARWSRGRTLR